MGGGAKFRDIALGGGRWRGRGGETGFDRLSSEQPVNPGSCWERAAREREGSGEDEAEARTQFVQQHLACLFA